MKEVYKPLFTPWKIRDVEFKNRIVLTSMGGTSIFGWMEPAHFDKEAAKFLLDRAKENVGLILPGIAPIKNPMMGGWLYSNKGMYKELKKFMEEFHKTGAKLFVQLTAGFGRSMGVNSLMVKAAKNKALGFMLKPIINVDYLCASASPTPNRWDNEIISKELTEKQIEDMIEAFAKTAKLCMEAGVDGVEIHAVHEGYLLDQFTMKYTNLRQDKWGGSLENRYRFPIEIVKRVKERCGENFPVSLRYSVVSKTKGFQQGALPGEKYIEAGRDLAESEIAAKLLQDAGYDMLNCDNGTYDAWYWAHPPGYMPENCNLEEVTHIKKYVNIPVVCAGRMTPEVAAKAIKEGKLDAMGVARQFLADPAWVTKLMNDQEEEIKPCICCHNACFNMCHYKGVGNDQSLSDTMGMARCAVNAETMQSKKHYIKKAKHKKNVAIVGGGIGGMECALVLAARGHTATIFEKTKELGGVFVAAASPTFKEKDRQLIDWYKLQISKNENIKVMFDTKIESVQDINAHGKFDEIVVCTGSKARSLNLPGKEKAVEAVDVLLKKVKLGKNPIIIGGGLTGCEIAYDLCLQGHEPIIVEMKNDLIAQTGVCLANSSYLREYFALHEVPVYLESKVKAITDSGVTIEKDGKEQQINGSDVILSVGYIPTPLFKEKSHVHLVGDCREIGNLRTVIWRAWDVAMKI